MSEIQKMEENDEFVETLLCETLGARPRPEVPDGFSGSVMKRLASEKPLRRSASVLLIAYWILAGAATVFILVRLPWGEWPSWVWMAAVPAALLVLTQPVRAISAISRFLQALFA